MMAERMYSRREMGVFSRNGSYLCSTFCGPITCTQAPFRNSTCRGVPRDYRGERWTCSAGTARTCAARSAAQSHAPRHHSEIVHIEGFQGLSGRGMGVFSMKGSYLCSTFCGPITCTQTPFRNSTCEGMPRDYPGGIWACSAGTACTCAAHSATQSHAPRHHSEIVHVEGCPGTIRERNGCVQQEWLVLVQHVLRPNHVHLPTVQK